MRAERPVRRSLAQPVQHLPGARAEQADHDLAVGERGVVVGNLAQARRGVGASAAAAIGSAAAGAFIGRGAVRRPTARAPRHRTAAQQSGCRSAPLRAAVAAGIPACPRGRGRGDKRGCHKRAATIAPSRASRVLIHGVVMKLKSLVSLLAARAGRLLALPAQAQTEIQWWHAMSGAARRVGQRPGQGLQREPEGLQGRARPSRAATTSR